ncbi:nuclear pore complex protein Nup107 [Tetranychus urticae]|uniref:Nuclear pore complex protein n=1 Tax=Tetranychus urticae TaxID=32264 RepID=T1KP10_TETUR|nr:nuclear pore complex protein Nup107 [Tetranychus urticae]
MDTSRMNFSLNSSHYNSMVAQSPAVRSSRSRYANLLSTSRQADLSNITFSSSFRQILSPTSPFLLPQEDTPEIREQVFPCYTLFKSFLESKKRLDEDLDLFTLAEEYEKQCCDHLSVLMSLKTGQPMDPKDVTTLPPRMETLLRSERNSWRIIRGLFEDRVKSAENSQLEMSDAEDMMVDAANKKMSDQEVIDAFFERDINARTMQLVIDWLERNEQEDMDSEKYCDKMEFYSEGPHSWENTLHSIKNRQLTITDSQHCLEMDPDAPIRSNRPLHDLDKEDENRLFKHILRYLRAGRLDFAKEIAEKLGHHWLAAVLDGWILFDDLNFKEGLTEDEGMLVVQGNACRDLWKYTCFKYSQMDNTNQSVYESAVIGALCGNLKPALSLLTRWSDRLWLLIRASLDCLIEQELRHTYLPNIVTARGSGPIENFRRSSVDLPDEYWSNLKSFVDIFREADACFKNENISMEEKCHQALQKMIILEDIEGALEFMIDWIRNNSIENEIRPQICRFFAHVVLFLTELKLIDTDSRRGFAISVLEEYIKYLIDWKEIELVAPYVSHLPPACQVTTYSKLLECITDRKERQLALKAAKEASLDIQSITKTVVETIRVDQHDMIKKGDLSTLPSNVAAESEDDNIKIDALDWLSIDDVNYIELLLQSNALLRQFSLAGKTDSSKKTLKKLPGNLIDGSLKMWRKKAGQKKKPPPRLNNAIREHLCHLAYSHAIEAFDEWLTYFTNSKPEEPNPPTSNRFTDKVAYQHSLKQYEHEVEQWKSILGLQARLSAEKIYNVLCFADGGWMVDTKADPEEDDFRKEQMFSLRKSKIPQLTFLLYTVLHSSNRLQECLQIADVISSEIYQLYKEFDRDQIKALLHKLRETSIVLLDQGKDCCGY